ncbi:MAG: hypothetical protein HYT99_02110 [Candidatus Tectomicrobia bacterium]|nr:hypothetical protein [Candidatus Tectomicrobia bacterium]
MEQGLRRRGLGRLRGGRAPARGGQVVHPEEEHLVVLERLVHPPGEGAARGSLPLPGEVQGIGEGRALRIGRARRKPPLRARGILAGVEGGEGPLQRGGRPSRGGQGGLLPPEPGGGGPPQRLLRGGRRGGVRAGLEAVGEVVAGLGGLLPPGKDAPQLLLGLPEDRSGWDLGSVAMPSPPWPPGRHCRSRG